MRTPSTKPKRRENRLWFVIPGVLMILVGFWLMVSCSFGGRLSAAESIFLPVGLTTAAVGGLVLTRSLLGTFFLFCFALTGLILAAREQGLVSLMLLPFVLLIVLCLPMAKHARH